MKLFLQPITLKEAHQLVKEHHRHHKPDRGGLFAVAANDGARVLGVVVVGRPKARMLQDGFTCEVTRCCIVEDLPTFNGHPLNVGSKLYAAAWRAARAMGYRTILTYTLKDESGVSLVAAGWKPIFETEEGKRFKSVGGSWDRPSRHRIDLHPLQEKIRWEAKQALKK